ncbi:hypothetical protein B0A53_01681 [Rhodotorula sp. CCFEE 5036]|nr:hypothetical protein B0A53_01681 [Rhodotorula sp. CCFEE 5036]
MPVAGSNRPLLLLTLLVFVGLFSLSRNHKDPQRIIAVGDVHGDLAALMQILRRAQLVDLRGHWIGGQDILVQTGDIVDRGPDTIAIYRFFQTLRPQAEAAGGALVSLLGNHELMNSLGDWRYVTKEDIASFGGERNRREAFSTGWIGQEFRTNYSITARVPYLIADDDFPASFAVQAPVLPKTPRGSSDRRFVGDPHVSPSFDAVANPFRLAAASFVHGGITPEYLASLPHDQPISEMNRIGHELLASLLAVPGHAPLGLPRTAPAEQREFWSERGPMWNRDWALEDEDEICERAEKACEVLRVRHLIQGHTPQFEGILSRCDGKILLIDTGISRAYGGAHSSLSITYTLSPASTLSVQDAIAHKLISASDADPHAKLETLGEVWIETELVEALYTKGRETETLGKWERVLNAPER